MTNTTEEREAWHKRLAARMKRDDTNGQSEMCHEMLEHDLSEQEILITLERKFFLSRKDSTNILETCKLFVDFS